jgi:putative membrane protein
MSNLQTLSGTAFDRGFIKEMIADHAKAIRMFEMAAQKLTDEDLRHFASGVLPTLQQHQEEAQSLAKEHRIELSRSGEEYEHREKNTPDPR